MELIDEYTQEIECEYKGERYKVRDNGAVFRLSKEGKKPRKLDNTWTFGSFNAKGYRLIAGHIVHIIVATAFHGPKDSSVYVVDHIDTNRANNRPENLRWLTRLENELLNEITRKKIEYICGSIESFLEDPSQLRKSQVYDSNFSWMREVTKEEAEITLKNWKKLIENPRPKQSTGKIGEWIYQSPAKSIPSHLDESSSLQGTLYERMKMENERKKAEEEKQREERRQQRLQKEKEKKLKQKELKATKKRIAKETITSFAESIGAQIETDAKGNGWKADFVLNYKNNKYAFLLFRTASNIEEQLQAFGNDNIHAYWLGAELNSFWRTTPHPFFPLELNGESLYVNLSTQNVALNDFLNAVINAKLQVSKPSIPIKAVKVRFCPVVCWNCDHQHYIYFVNGIVRENESTIITYQDMYDKDISVDDHNPIIVSSVKKYLSLHTEMNYRIGDIKERHSNSMETSYLSFGCPYCDAIFGDHFLKEIKADYIYEADDDDVHMIELTEPLNISSDTPYWTITD